MSNGLKYTLSGVGVVILLILGAFFLLDSIVASSTETIGTELTGTTVSVESASVSPFSGSGTLSGFRVENPDEYEADYAMEASEISVALDLSTLWSGPIVVENIHIKDPRLTLVQNKAKNNLRTLLQNVNQGAEEGTSSDSEMIVEHFLMEEGTLDVRVGVGGDRSTQVTIPRIEVNDLGTDDQGVAVENIIREVTNRVVGTALKAAGGNWMDQAKDAVDGLFN